MLLNEIWKDIPNYEGLYQISDLGRIKSLHWGKEKILKQTIRSKNYPYYFIGLLKDKKRKYYAIHRLVAEVFVANPNKYTQVDHIDGNKLNNKANNLEWVTPKENTQRAWKIGLAKNTERQRKIAKETMLKRWKDNNHRKVAGVKRTREEKRQYQREYYRKHKKSNLAH